MLALAEEKMGNPSFYNPLNTKTYHVHIKQIIVFCEVEKAGEYRKTTPEITFMGEYSHKLHKNK